MGQRDTDLPARRRFGGTAADADPRRLPRDHLDLAQSKAVPQTQRLDHGLLRREARGEVASGARAAGGVRALGLGEDPRRETRVSLQGPLQPADLEQVDAEPWG